MKQKLVDQIHAKVNELNPLLKRASALGLSVDVRTKAIDIPGEREMYVFLQADIFEPAPYRSFNPLDLELEPMQIIPGTSTIYNPSREELIRQASHTQKIESKPLILSSKE